MSNYRYFSKTGELLSTEQVAAARVKHWRASLDFLKEYLTLGDGSLVRQFILGENMVLRSWSLFS